ncbi:hypothetical protein HMPREF1583_01275 [Gardnerella vaginalis JCP8151B]|nr:hypothetical protein HMPREF1583_01275 [Gardnerella vaginalis JCP8151B]
MLLLYTIQGSNTLAESYNYPLILCSMNVELTKQFCNHGAFLFTNYRKNIKILKKSFIRAQA